jgi:hypothetical protein
MGQHHTRPASCPIRVKDRPRTLDLLTQWHDQGNRQHGDTILAALSLQDEDLPPTEIDILDPQAHALHQPHAGAVHDRLAACSYQCSCAPN